MQKSSTHFFLVICVLASASVACLSTALPATLPAITRGPMIRDVTQMPADAALASAPMPSRTSLPGCAVVIADEALHLRVDPDPDSQIIAFMPRGETVKLISVTIDDWWLIKRGEVLGYARSKYMMPVDCR